MVLADEGNYRESRWFVAWTQPGFTSTLNIPVPFSNSIQPTVPFGDAILDLEDTVVGAEICEELFAPINPHLSMATIGNVEIFLNGSASHHELGKLRRKFELILGATGKVTKHILRKNFNLF